MRKHPDAIAIVFVGLVLLVGAGVRSVKHQVQTQALRVQQLKITEEVMRETREAADSVKKEAREGMLEFKDALRESLRDEVRRAIGRRP
ncbi:hypothetical protein F183_A54250 [Bryobacterales bacterium F-183]|nr:hypothetical protein F183_A54250 [Bryobacterales bacterium F-183]